MTAEPIREPEADEPAPARSETPPPEPPPSETTSVDAAMAVDAAASEAAFSAALDAGAPGIEAPTTPVDTPQATPDAPAVVADAPATPRPSRRPVVLAVVRRLTAVALAVVLFASGVVLGNTTFLRTRAAPLTDGAIVITDPPPAVARELIRALGANDSDAMRSSLPAQPNKDLTDEFTRFDIKKINSVETLGTSVDGSRSATEILLHAEKTNGLPFEVNLVILVDGGQIEGFR